MCGQKHRFVFTAVLMTPKYGNRKILRNVSKYLPVDTAQHPRRFCSSKFSDS